MTAQKLMLSIFLDNADLQLSINQNRKTTLVIKGRVSSIFLKNKI